MDTLRSCRLALALALGMVSERRMSGARPHAEHDVRAGSRRRPTQLRLRPPPSSSPCPPLRPLQAR